jgi:hypothetical protein
MEKNKRGTFCAADVIFVALKCLPILSYLTIRGNIRGMLEVLGNTREEFF